MCVHTTIGKICMYIYIAKLFYMCTHIRFNDDCICYKVNGRFRCCTSADLQYGGHGKPGLHHCSCADLVTKY